jgi:Ca2+-binding EF-hand superfamily protein
MAEPATEEMMEEFRSFFPKRTKKEMLNLFRNLLPDRKNKLNLKDFKDGVTQGVKTYDRRKVSPEDLSRVFAYIAEGDSQISSEAMIKGMRGKLNQYRQFVCDYVFEQLDMNKSGFIEEAELKKWYGDSVLPVILLKTVTPREAAANFFKNVQKAVFLDKNQKLPKISKAQLAEFYIDFGCSSSSDGAFSRSALDEWLFKEDIFQKWIKEKMKAMRAEKAAAGGAAEEETSPPAVAPAPAPAPVAPMTPASAGGPPPQGQQPSMQSPLANRPTLPANPSAKKPPGGLGPNPSAAGSGLGPNPSARSSSPMNGGFGGAGAGGFNTGNVGVGAGMSNPFGAPAPAAGMNVGVGGNLANPFGGPAPSMNVGVGGNMSNPFGAPAPEQPAPPAASQAPTQEHSVPPATSSSGSMDNVMAAENGEIKKKKKNKKFGGDLTTMDPKGTEDVGALQEMVAYLQKIVAEQNNVINAQQHTIADLCQRLGYPVPANGAQ